MAMPRLLGSKVRGDFKFPLSSLKHFNYNYKCGRNAALFVHNGRKFQTKSLFKSVSTIENSLKKLYLHNYTKLVEDTNSLFYKVIYQLTSPKSSYNVLSFGGSNRDDDRYNEDDSRAQLPGDGPERSLNSWPVFLALTVMWIMLMSGSKSNMPETSWPIFLRLMLQTGEVERLNVSASKDRVYVYLRNGAIINGLEVFGFGPHYSFTIGNLKNFEQKLKDAQEKLGIKPSDFIPVKYSAPDSEFGKSELIKLAITVGIIGVIGYFLIGGRKGASKSGLSLNNPFSYHTRAKATIILPGSGKGIGFKDVAGMREAKEEVKEFVDYLKYPGKFQELGAKIPKGALLCGPPGTGKTLLAKAVSTEAAVPFLSMAGSDFVEMFAGVGSARVRDLFAQARRNAPCIVYIDEVDAIGRSRGTSTSGGGNSEQESTLNQLLVEMDGINSTEGVVMLASTNRPDVLDNALLRPGRFDRNITIDLPTLPERKEIFEIYLSQLKLGKSLHKYSKRLAELTPGKSGADVANICNEAALHAARINSKSVDQENFEYAIERVIAGMQKNNNPLGPEERNIVAYHEAGHVIVSWMLKHTEPVLKISTIPRTHSPLGFIQKFPLDIKLHSNEQLFDKMCSLLGGRVAESLVFHRITTGAEDDLKKVTDLSYQQIVVFGMNKRIGPISFPPKRKGELARKPYGDKMARAIDEEASLMVAKAHKVTEQILQEHRDKLDILASTLLEKEVLNYDELVNLIGQSPHGDKMKSYYSNQLHEDGDTDFKPDPALS